MKLLGFTGSDAVATDGVVSAVMEDLAGGYRRSFQMPLIRALLAARGDVVLGAEALFGLGSVLGDSVSMCNPMPEWGGRSAYELVKQLRALLAAEFGEGWRMAVVAYLTPVCLVDPAMSLAPVTPCGLSGREVLRRFRAAVLGKFGDDLLVKRAQLALDLALVAEVSLRAGELPARAIIFDDVLRPCEAKWLQDRGGVVVYVDSHNADDRVSVGRSQCDVDVWNDLGDRPDPVHTLSKVSSWLARGRDIGVGAKRTVREVA